MKIETDNEYKEVKWLYTLTNDCLSQDQGENTNIPAKLCERAASLFLAGAFVSA